MNKQKLKYYCKCGNKISSRTALYGLGTCGKCNGKKLSKLRKGKKRSLQIKRNISRACMGRTPWNKGKKCPQTSGSKNGSWRGGITKLSLRIRSSIEYAIWRTKIFERDDYACQECNVRCGYGKTIVLNAHHKIAFAKLLNFHKIKTLEEAISCKHLWKLSLGKTLCVKCHDKTKKGIKI